jgi:hypothetical protein
MYTAFCLNNAIFFLTTHTPTVAQSATQAEPSLSWRKLALLSAQLSSSQANQTNGSAQLVEKVRLAHAAWLWLKLGYRSFNNTKYTIKVEGPN